MAREAMEVCLRVLKESNKSRFNSCSVRNSELIVSHITFRDCREHIFSDNLPRDGCIRRRFAPRNLAIRHYIFTFPSGFCCVVYIALHREGKPVSLKVPVDIQSTRDHTRKKDHIIYEERYAVFNFLIQILPVYFKV